MTENLTMRVRIELVKDTS